MPPNCGSPHKKAAHGWMMGFPKCSDDTSTLGKTTGSAKLDASSKKNWYSPEWSEPPSGPKCICYWHQKTSTATPDEESLQTSSETKRIGAGVHWRLLNLKIAWSLPYPNHGLGDFVAESRREGNPGIAKAFLVLLQAQVPAREWAWLRKKPCCLWGRHGCKVLVLPTAWTRLRATQPVPRGGHIVPSVLGAAGEPLPSFAIYANKNDATNAKPC